MDGITDTGEIIAAAPGVRILILTTFEDDDYVFGALSAGASGFLLKRTQPEQLIAAIHAIAAVANAHPHRDQLHGPPAPARPGVQQAAAAAHPART